MGGGQNRAAASAVRHLRQRPARPAGRKRGPLRARREPKKLIMLKGYGHYEVYEGDTFRQVMEATTDWYRQYLPAH